MNYARQHTQYMLDELQTLEKMIGRGKSFVDASIVLERTPSALKQRYRMIRFARFVQLANRDDTMRTYYKRKKEGK